MHSNIIHVDPFKRLAKDSSISHIKKITADLLQLQTDSILILQFGSAYFKADDLPSSDFDIVLILQFNKLKDAYPSLTTTEDMRH